MRDALSPSFLLLVTARPKTTRTHLVAQRAGSIFTRKVLPTWSLQMDSLAQLNGDKFT